MPFIERDVYAYFKKELHGDSLSIWKKKMIDRETFDPEFGLRLGIAYYEIMDKEIEVKNREYDDKIAEAMYLCGPTYVRRNPKKALRESRRHINRVWETKRRFEKYDRDIIKKIRYTKNLKLLLISYENVCVTLLYLVVILIKPLTN